AAARPYTCGASGLVSADRLEDLLAAPFGLDGGLRAHRQLALLNELTAHHVARCGPYARIVERLFGVDAMHAATLVSVPWIPVSLFKTLDLQSVPDDEILRVLHSSGTT